MIQFAAADFCEFIRAIDGFCQTFHSHIEEADLVIGEPLAVVYLSGVENGETLADDEPDAIFLDLELYAATPEELETLQTLLYSVSGYNGVLANARGVQDVEFTDQRDDYTPQANGESLPRLFVSMQVELRGYYA